MRVGCLNTLERIFDNNAGDMQIMHALDFFRRLENPETPTHSISLSRFYISKAHLFRRVNGSRTLVEDVMERYESILYEIGYRQNINTAQEHALIGSSEWKDYLDEPYTPIGLIKGSLTLEEVSKARGLLKGHSAIQDYFEVSPEDLVCDNFSIMIKLEDINEEGRTVRDPRICGLDFTPRMTIYKPNFPFLR
jgi:hypothetical protein